MSIYTHRALAVSGITDNGLLHAGGWGRICKMFFPFTETSGSVFRDVVNGLTITASAAPTYTVDYAPTMRLNVGAPTSGVTPILGTSDFALVMLSKSGSASSHGMFRVGTSSADGLTCFIDGSSGFCTYDEGAGAGVSTTSAYTEGASKQYFDAMVRDGTDIYHYSSVDGAAFTVSAAADITSADQDMQNGDFIQIGDGATNSPRYACAVFVFQDGIPSDIQTAFEFYQTQWLAGNKTLDYTPWRSLL